MKDIDSGNMYPVLVSVLSDALARSLQRGSGLRLSDRARWGIWLQAPWLYRSLTGHRSASEFPAVGQLCSTAQEERKNSMSRVVLSREVATFS